MFNEYDAHDLDDDYNVYGVDDRIVVQFPKYYFIEVEQKNEWENYDE